MAAAVSFLFFWGLEFFSLLGLRLEGAVTINHLPSCGNQLCWLDAASGHLCGNLRLIGLAAGRAAARCSPARLLEVDLRAHGEVEVGVAVLAIDGEGCQLLRLLGCATVDAADRSLPAVLLVVLLCAYRVDEVRLAVSAGDVLRLRALSLRLLLLAARVAARRRGEALLREEGLVLVREEEVGLAVATGEKLATVDLLCLSAASAAATRLLGHLGESGVSLGLLLLRGRGDCAVCRVMLSVEGGEARLSLRGLLLLLEGHDLLLDGERRHFMMDEERIVLDAVLSNGRRRAFNFFYLTKKQKRWCSAPFLFFFCCYFCFCFCSFT